MGHSFHSSIFGTFFFLNSFFLHLFETELTNPFQLWKYCSCIKKTNKVLQKSGFGQSRLKIEHRRWWCLRECLTLSMVSPHLFFTSVTFSNSNCLPINSWLRSFCSIYPVFRTKSTINNFDFFGVLMYDTALLLIDANKMI